MNAIYFLLPLALLLSIGFLIAFIFSTMKGQFDDLDTPAKRILLDDINYNDKNKGKKQ